MDARLESVIAERARFNWWAALLAGLISGGIVWLLSHGIPWFTSGMVSPTLMGRDLKPPGAVDPHLSAWTVLLHLVLSIGYAMVIGLLAGQLRGLWALVAGAVVGLGLYALNYAAFNYVLAVEWSGNELSVLVAHLVFATVAAGAYKGLASRRPRHKVEG
jgi:hypothetical protein